MKFKVNSTGAILETNNDFAIKQMEKSPNYEVVTEEKPQSYSRMKLEDLKTLAAERGIEVPESAEKADIVKLLKADDEANK